MKTRQAIAMTQLRLLKQLPVVHAIGALVRTVYLDERAG